MALRLYGNSFPNRKGFGFSEAYARFEHFERRAASTLRTFSVSTSTQSSEIPETMETSTPLQLLEY